MYDVRTTSKVLCSSILMEQTWSRLTRTTSVYYALVIMRYLHYIPRLRYANIAEVRPHDCCTLYRVL